MQVNLQGGTIVLRHFPKMAPFCIVDIPIPSPVCILDAQVFLLLQTTLILGGEGIYGIQKE